MPSHVAMNANTAVGLALASIALCLLTLPATRAWRNRLALGCSLLVAALGTATLAEYLLRTDLGIDNLLGIGPSVEFNTTTPGRTAPETALNLALIGIALCGMRRPRFLLGSQSLTVLVAMLGLFNIVGFVYGAVAFYKLDHKSSIGISTAMAFVVLGAGMLLARPENGLIRSITSRLPGGVVMRRMLLAALILPLALGWLELVGEREGLYSHAHGSGITGVIGSLALVIIIWRTARILDRTGRGTQQLQSDLRASNELLKQSVRERTVLLATANRSLNRGITERDRLEALLHLQASALESAANSIVIYDRTGVIEWVNPAYSTLTGYNASEALGCNPRDSKISGQHDESFDKTMWTTVLSGKVWRGEVVNKRKDGSIFTVHQTVTPVRDKHDAISHFISIEEDITEKRKLEEVALRTQRIRNLGMLAAGIAHDFNNALSPILMAAPLLRPQVSSPGGQHMLDIVEHCSERGAALVRQMLSFARGSLDQKVQVRLSTVLEEVIDLAKTTFPRSIRIASRVADDLLPMLGDPTQINQVFMNLVINARDAITVDGEISITAENCVVDDALASRIPDAKTGQYLAIRVRDNGSGIPPEILASIWEPFFTTKSEGRGTGLGLSTVRGIVRQHEGFLSVETVSGNAADHGTAFTVYFPASAVSAPSERPLSGGEPERRGAGELILVVDDDDSVLEVVGKVLTRQGYRVVSGADGAEAISVFAARSQEVSLLITDSDMPIVGGKALIGALRRISPDLPVIIMSGAEGRHRDIQGILSVSYLAKPFTASTLLAIVGRTLDAARSKVPWLVET